jgi:hypothetical protein
MLGLSGIFSDSVTIDGAGMQAAGTIGDSAARVTDDGGGMNLLVNVNGPRKRKPPVSVPRGADRTLPLENLVCAWRVAGGDGCVR